MKTRFLQYCLVPGLLSALVFAGCGNGQGGGSSSPSTPTNTATATASAAPTATPSAAPTAAAGTPAQYSFQIVNSYPHDRGAFIQGLIVEDPNTFLESTGLNGQSSLRRVDLKTGTVKKKVDVDSKYFAEGMTTLGGLIYQLTWKAHKGFIYEQDTFKQVGTFEYSGEGWGLTHDTKSLILSDGTSKIRFLDPATFKVTKTITVKSAGDPVTELNELEYIKGEIWANVWQQDYIVRIDPATGNVLGWIDLMGLLPAGERAADTDVLNGIAYDAAQDKIYLTGKLWPKVYEVKIVPAPSS